MGRQHRGRSIGGRYRLERKLGEGAHGVVYRARHLDLELDVAIKLLQPQLHQNPRAEQRFLREIYLATCFVHKYVVQLRDFGRDPDVGCLYYTMDLVEGETLDAALQREGALDEMRAIAIGSQILEALEEAHDAGVIHRDLKPGNLLLTRGHVGVEEVRILDFGLAKAVSADAARPAAVVEELTVPGARVGTLGYMSPEQVLGRPADHRSDLYAVAVMLYETLTRRRPCAPEPGTQDPAQAFLLNLTSRPPVPVRQLNRDVSPALDEALLRALAKKPDERFGTARAFREALDRAAELLVTRPPARERPSDEGQVEPPRGRSGRRRVAAGGVAVVDAPAPQRAGTSSRRRRSSGVRRRLPERLPEGLVPGSEEGTVTNARDGSTLVWVPPGTYRMGSERTRPEASFPGLDLPRGTRLGREFPVHVVRVTRGFFLGRTPVTWKQLRRFCRERGQPVPTTVDFPGVSGISDAHPAVNVSYRTARAYCRWAGGRLPTEAEWELAARGTDERLRPWGDGSSLSRRCNWAGHPEHGGRSTSPAGEFPAGASPVGCLDMAGNVWEWVLDAYANYPSSPQTDPRRRGSEGLRERVIRGGAWCSPAGHCTATSRFGLAAGERHNWLGFRLCVPGGAA